MANQTDPFAETVHGSNPQHLIEKITRLKIYNSTYWKEECFGLTAETIIDKAIVLKYCGGLFGGSVQPTKFLCLVLKLLQLQPDKDIVLEFIRNEDFKYLRILGAFYFRLIRRAEEIYQCLEPLYNDYRKIAYRSLNGWTVKRVDELVDSLLTEELVCDISLPHIPKRIKLEDLGILKVRESVLDIELDGQREDEGVVEEDTRSIHSSEDNKQSHPHISDTESIDEFSKSIIASVSAEVPSISESITHPKVIEKENKDKDRGDQEVRSSDKREAIRRRDRSDSRDYRRKYDDRDRRDRRSRERFDSRDRRVSRRERSRSPIRRSNSRRRDNSRSRRRRNDSEDSRREHTRRSGRDRKRYSRSRSSSRSSNSSHSHSRSRSSASSSSRSRSRSPVTREHNEVRETVVSVQDEIKLQKKQAAAAAAKRFDKIFKPSKTTVSAPVNSSSNAAAPEGSVEYWNQMREKLGIKKLRE